MIATAAAVALAAGVGVSAHAAPVQGDSLQKGAVQSVASEQAQFDQSKLEELFNAIDQIPEEVLLKGDKATQKWVAKNLTQSGVGEQNVVAARGFLQCSGAILLAIGTTAIPVAKILKIKKLMNSLGGVSQAIKIMWGASFSHEKLLAVGGAAAALGAELLGIAAIQKSCK